MSKVGASASASGEQEPIVCTGDKLRLPWPQATQATGKNVEMRRASVVSVERSRNLKQGSWFKYKLKLRDTDEVVETRLRHLEFQVKKVDSVDAEKKGKRVKAAASSSSSKKKSDPDNREKEKPRKRERDAIDDSNTKAKARKVDQNTTATTSRSSSSSGSTISHIMKRKGLADWAIPSHRNICAPMVGGSELAFRLLCRRYGCDLAYTPMISSARFAVDAEYRAQEFQTTPEDRPLVAHFSGNDPQQMLAAAKLVENECDAIDLNLGCPQRVAFVGHYGSFLLDDIDRPLVLDIVSTLAAKVKIPIFVKIRLLSTVEETVTLCKQLAKAGAALVAIHARHRVNLVKRDGPGARDGAAFLDQVAEVRRVVSKDVLIISNGNIREHGDIAANMELTKADGVMSAEGLLDNPAIFDEKRQDHNKIELALEYLQIAKKHPVKIKSVVFHTRRIIRDDLNAYQLMEELCACSHIDDIIEIVNKCKHYQDTQSYVFDAEKEMKAKKALEKRKHEEGKRKRYEGRMTRKAKREGKEESFYLSIGAENPTLERLQYLKSIPHEEAFASWKERHSQHCFEYHFSPDKCKRDRTCAFLHADPAYHSGDAEVFG